MPDPMDKSESAEPEPKPEAESSGPPPRPAQVDRRRPAGDGLASIVGSGGSQVGTNGAMRARDVSRPR
jgi:hypothetical protein